MSMAASAKELMEKPARPNSDPASIRLYITVARTREGGRPDRNV